MATAENLFLFFLSHTDQKFQSRILVFDRTELRDCLWVKDFFQREIENKSKKRKTVRTTSKLSYFDIISGSKTDGTLQG